MAAKKKLVAEESRIGTRLAVRNQTSHGTSKLFDNSHRHGPWFICFVAIFSVYFYRCYLVRNRFAIKEGINANLVLNGNQTFSM